MRSRDKYVFDANKGAWVLNTHQAAEKLGYSDRGISVLSYARDRDDFVEHKEERSAVRTSFSKFNMLDIGGTYESLMSSGDDPSGEKKSRKKPKYRWWSDGQGFHGKRGENPSTMTPWLPQPNRGWNFPPRTDIAYMRKLYRELPAYCTSCRHYPACSSWLSGRIFTRGSHLCIAAQKEVEK